MPKTQDDLRFIKSQFPNSLIWLGASDQEQEGDWKWVDGTEMDRQLFSGGQPSGGLTKNCLGMSTKGSKMFLTDVKCSKPAHILCEYPAKKQCVIKN